MKKVEELASHYERNPLPTVYRPRLSKPSMPSSVWKIFSRQAEAFNYVKTCQEVYYVLCLCSLYTFKIEHNLNFLLAVKSLSVFFFPVLNQQIFVLVFVLFLLFFFVFVGHAALEVSLRSTSSVLPFKLICGVNFKQWKCFLGTL